MKNKNESLSQKSESEAVPVAQPVVPSENVSVKETNLETSKEELEENNEEAITTEDLALLKEVPEKPEMQEMVLEKKEYPMTDSPEIHLQTVIKQQKASIESLRQQVFELREENESLKKDKL